MKWPDHFFPKLPRPIWWRILWSGVAVVFFLDQIAEETYTLNRIYSLVVALSLILGFGDYIRKIFDWLKNIGGGGVDWEKFKKQERADQNSRKEEEK